MCKYSKSKNLKLKQKLKKVYKYKQFLRIFDN